MSQFSSFTRCGEQYRLERVAHAPKRPAAWLAQGVAFHHAAEKWEGSLRAITDDEADFLYLNEYDRIITEEMEKEPDLSRWLTGGRVRASDDIPRRRERGAAQLDGYLRYARQAPERPWRYMGDEVAVEVPFSLDLGGIEVVGYIDQILDWNGRIMPRDLKTGAKKPDWAFQLGLYALAIESDYGILPQWGDYWMAKDGLPCPPVLLESFTREKVTRWFKDMDRAVRNGTFLPSPGDACRTCSVSDFCTAMGSRSSEFQPEEEE